LLKEFYQHENTNHWLVEVGLGWWVVGLGEVGWLRHNLSYFFRNHFSSGGQQKASL
jgi:hypothetical protein